MCFILSIYRPFDEKADNTEWGPFKKERDGFLGELGTQSILSAILAMQATHFIGRYESNWSRLLNELRKSNVVAHELQIGRKPKPTKWYDLGNTEYQLAT